MSTETTPTAEPWVEAANKLFQDHEGVIKDACLAYAAQQTEVLNKELEHQRKNLTEAARCELARLDHELDRVKAEREALFADISESNRQRDQAIAQLTAAKAALEAARPLVKCYATMRPDGAYAEVLDQIEKALS